MGIGPLEGTGFIVCSMVSGGSNGLSKGPVFVLEARGEVDSKVRIRVF